MTVNFPIVKLYEVNFVEDACPMPTHWLCHIFSVFDISL